jgi:hypothetical protein
MIAAVVAWLTAGLLLIEERLNSPIMQRRMDDCVGRPAVSPHPLNG